MNFKPELETMIESAIKTNNPIDTANLVRAYAALKNAENLEKVIETFTGAGAAMQQAASQLNPEMLNEIMKNQGR